MTPAHRSIDLATSGPSGEADLLFVHASGFCKEVWHPIARRLESAHPRLIWRSVDIRGHGDSPKPDPPYRWDWLATDIVATLGETKPMLGVGHSVGGALITRIASEYPNVFDSLVLIEPIIFPPPHARLDIPLAGVAERRRATFPTRQAAYDAFVKRAFQRWDSEVLEAYVDHGFEATPDGWTLKCAPDVEADVYREGANHDTWERIPRLELPVTIIVGAESDTHREPYLGGLAAQFSNVRVVIVERTGHLVPMEKPQELAAEISLALRNR